MALLMFLCTCLTSYRKFLGGTSLLKLGGGGGAHCYSILVYSLAGLREIYDHFSNVYTYEYSSYFELFSRLQNAFLQI